MFASLLVPGKVLGRFNGSNVSRLSLVHEFSTTLAVTCFLHGI
jgi:hypothetical protein